MKQVIKYSIIGCVSILAGCKKHYECTCTYNNGTSDTTEVYDIGKKTGQDAKETCSAQEESLEYSGISDPTCIAIYPN